MVDTAFHLPADKLPRLATLYHKYFVTELTVLDYSGFVRDPKVVPNLASGGGGLYSTARDYARFAQMLLGKGELGGVRIISTEAAELMMRNQLSEPIIAAGGVVGAQKVCPGRGYGFDGAVFYDPGLAGAPVGRGTYQWDGASGVWFWIDPENDLVFVGMIQRILQAAGQHAAPAKPHPGDDCGGAGRASWMGMGVAFRRRVNFGSRPAAEVAQSER